MAFWQILLLALGLSIDAFSVSFALGHRLINSSAIFRVSFHFGVFQGLMPLVGWTLGTKLSSIIGAYDHWVAFGVLTLIALRMLIDSLRPLEGEKKFDPSRGLSLVGLSISVSIDALGVGLGMGVLKLSIIFPCLVFAAFASTMSVIGIYLGKVLSSIIGRRIETLGAIILFIIALHLLKI